MLRQIRTKKFFQATTITFAFLLSVVKAFSPFTSSRIAWSRGLFSSSSTEWQSFSSSDEVISENYWSIADDWTSLSDTSSSVDSSVVFDGKWTAKVAKEMAAASPKLNPMSREDIWIRDILDEIHNAFSTLENDPPLYDTSLDELSVDSVLNDMSNEIAMLIRCNEEPELMLISEGRALPPLTKAEKDDLGRGW
jgi:hypothetical protein